MTTPDNLAAKLGNLQLSTSQQDISSVHLLSLEFPAVELLPSMSTPFLTPPSDIERRARPKQESVQSNTLGTNYFAVLPVNLLIKLTDGPDYENDSFRRLLKAIDHLEFRTGSSTLRMVAFDAANGNAIPPRLIYRFQLDTEYHEDGRLSQQFDLDDTDWEDLVAMADEEKWISLLHDLVTRGSERAFFQVQSVVLSAYGPEAVKSEEAGWTHLWLPKLPSTAEELFMARLQPVTAADAERMQSEGDGVLHLELPCGHVVFIRKINIVALTARDCAVQRCPQCQLRIMQPTDDDEYRQRRNWESLKSYRATSRHWKALDRCIPNGDSSYLFDTAAVLRVIKITLAGFNMPSSVCHPQLCPALFRETKQILDTFEKQYGGTPVAFGMSRLDLLESLYGIAMGTHSPPEGNDTIAKSCVVPNYSEFLTLWLTRAVHLLTQNTCTKRGIRHIGLHQHRNSQWYNSLTPNIVDGVSEESDDEYEEEEERDMEAALSAMETQMEETHMS